MKIKNFIRELGRCVFELDREKQRGIIQKASELSGFPKDNFIRLAKAYNNNTLKEVFEEIVSRLDIEDKEKVVYLIFIATLKNSHIGLLKNVFLRKTTEAVYNMDLDGIEYGFSSHHFYYTLSFKWSDCEVAYLGGQWDNELKIVNIWEYIDSH